MKAFEPVKVDSCNNCGSTVKQYSLNSEVVICEHCGVNSTDITLQKRSSKKVSKVPKNPLLKLYETFEYQSVTWQIIGCISYKGSVREWDSEDDVWETNPWKYNSWWVMNEAREIAWIIHDSTGYKWSRKSVMKGRIPENNRSYEKGSWRIASAVGEFSYFPAIGGTSTTYERNDTSIEILNDSEGNKKEVEAFLNTPIKALDLFKAFKKTNLINALERSKLAQKVILASIVCLLVGYFALTLRSETLLKVTTETITHPLSAQAIPLGEFSLDNKSLLQFRFGGLIPNGNGNFDGDLIIKDDKDMVVSTLSISFWRASGYDSDGSWTETTKSVAPYLNLPANKKYQLTLKPTNLFKWKNISITGHVKKNMASFTPMIVGIVLFVLLLLFQFITKQNFIRKHTGMKA